MRWKDIPNFEGYQVSDTGLVRTHNKVTSNARYSERHWKNRILKFKNAPSSTRNQARVNLWKDGKPYDFLVARLVAFTFYEKDINDHSLEVNHIDGNWKNNNLENLELVSHKENMNHAFDNHLISSAKETILENKETHEELHFRSMSKASLHIGKNTGYISEKRLRGSYENETYRWRFKI